MGLPESRNTTYAPGSQLLSDDLNALQDAVVGNHHGVITKSILPASDQDWDDASGRVSFLSARTVSVALPIADGDELRSIRATLVNFSGDVEWAAYLVDRTSGVRTTIGSDSPPTLGAFAVREIDLSGAPVTISGDALFVAVTGAVGDSLASIAWDTVRQS